MKLTILGTGNAAAVNCYNTCFVLTDGDRHLLVDGGGGNGLFSQLKAAGLDWKDMRDIFVTHKHVDHLLGIVWMMRYICQNMARGKYEGEARIYAHAEVIEILKDMAEKLFVGKHTQYIGDRLHMIVLEDGEEREIIGHKMRFFDTRSNKARQFGFQMELEGGAMLSCCGDEPYQEHEKPYVEGSKWMLVEAFCVSEDADIYRPYEKSHSTAADAGKNAKELGIENLILYHTEDNDLPNRKERYSKDAKAYFSGNVFVPDDLEVFEL